MPEKTEKHRHPPPWLFGIVGIPYGVGGGFISGPMPVLATRADYSISDIGWFFALLFVPTYLQFLYAPTVDVGMRRKYWFVLCSVIGGACFAAAFATPVREQTTAFLVFAFMGQLVTGLTGSCNGGLLAMTMPDDKRGKAAGWLNIGNLSGGGIAVWLAIYMLDQEVAPWLVGVMYGAFIVLPGLPILLVDEPPRSRRTARQVFGDMWRSVKEVMTSKQGLTGFALCLSPVGSAALSQFFAGMQHAFGAGDRALEVVTGAGNVLPTLIGAAVGGWLCDMYSRRALYLLSGLLTAACGVAMAIAPHTEATYLWGAMTYLLVTGFCYSAFTATVLETIGDGGPAASTRYALFVAAGNFAIWYTGVIDTRFGGTRLAVDGFGTMGMPSLHAHPVVAHVIFSDVALNVIGVIVLGIAFWRLGSFGRSRRNRPSAPVSQQA